MKKSFKALSLLSACLCGVTVFAGCGLFGGEGGGSSKGKYEFAIQYGEEQNKYSFENKENIHVDPRYKEGFVLDGFYTQPNGEGTKMLDWRGTCLSSSFSGDGSTVLYPNYKEIDYDYVLKGPVWRDEDPLSTSYNVYGDPRISYCEVSVFKNIDYILQVATANPDLEFKISGVSQIKGSTGKYYIGLGKALDKSSLIENTSVSSSSSYKEYTVACTVRGKALTIDGTNIMLGFYCNKFANEIYYKNMQLTISIVKPESEEEKTPETDTDTDTGTTNQ